VLEISYIVKRILEESISEIEVNIPQLISREVNCENINAKRYQRVVTPIVEEIIK
jgi:hypothetical protein